MPSRNPNQPIVVFDSQLDIGHWYLVLGTRTPESDPAPRSPRADPSTNPPQPATSLDILQIVLESLRLDHGDSYGNAYYSSAARSLLSRFRKPEPR